MHDSQAKLETAKRPLAGLRVLDFSIMVAGPYCSRILADMGADVVKVEPPEGDDMRLRPPLRSAPDGTRHGSYFGQLNAGKRSIALDLKQAGDLATAKALAMKADVVLENFRPGVMQRLGLGSAALCAANPRLVYASISGYGQTGPAAERAAYAMVVQAASGYEATVARWAGGDARPKPIATFVADVLGGINAYSAITTALLQRSQTGLGQTVDVALMDGMLNLLIYELQEAQFAVPTARATYGPVAASDGDVIIVPITQRNFEALAQLTDLPEFRGNDPRFANVATRAAHWSEMMAIAQRWTRKRTCAQALVELEAAGVPCSHYAQPGDMLNDAQAQSRGLFSAVHDAAGPFLGVNAPWIFPGDGAAGANTTQIERRVPRVGENGADIRREWLEL